MTSTDTASTTGPDSAGFRIEKDALGEVRVPADHYWGAQTQRSVENFRIGVGRFTWGRPVIRALGVLKLCAAQANLELGRAPGRQGRPHRGGGARGDRRPARRRVPARRLPDRVGHPDEHERQRGDRRAGERAGRRRSRRQGSRSTRTTMSTARNRPTTRSRRSCTSRPSRSSRLRLIPAVEALRDTLRAKSAAYADVVMLGRTHLQDATPVTVGQVIGGWAAQLEATLAGIRATLPGLYELALGGTAVGTGLNADPRFGELAAARIAAETGRPFVGAPDKFAALSAHDAVVAASAAAADARRRLDEDRQRRPLVRLRAARGDRRAADPGERARLVDHAGQDQPDPERGADPGRGPGLRQRRRGGLRRLAGQLPAQRLQAGDARQPAHGDRRCWPRRSARSTATAPSGSSRTWPGSASISRTRSCS